MKKKTVVGILVLSLVVLGACSSHKKQETTTKTTKSEQSSEKQTQIEKKASSEQSESSEVTVSSSDGTTTQSVEQAPERDLNPDAIDQGDLSTLVGGWKNGDGESLMINADGSGTITIVGSGTYPCQVKTAATDPDTMEPGVSRIGLGYGPSGSAMPLFKIGVPDSYGDQSDTSRPRLLLTTHAGHHATSEYFYRVN